MLGLAFKQDVSDLRNSKVADLVTTFRDLGHAVDVHDPLVSADEARHEYGLDIVAEPTDTYDLVVLAVPHRVLVDGFYRFAALLGERGAVADIKNALGSRVPANARLWTM